MNNEYIQSHPIPLAANKVKKLVALYIQDYTNKYAHRGKETPTISTGNHNHMYHTDHIKFCLEK